MLLCFGLKQIGQTFYRDPLVRQVYKIFLEKISLGAAVTSSKTYGMPVVYYKYIMLPTRYSVACFKPAGRCFSRMHRSVNRSMLHRSFFFMKVTVNCVSSCTWFEIGFGPGCREREKWRAVS